MAVIVGCRWAADDGADVDFYLPRRHHECARCNVRMARFGWDVTWHEHVAPGCRLDLDRPWNPYEYAAGHIADSVNVVAWALDKVIKECLGDPSSPRVITQMLEQNVWNSTLTLSAALNSTPLQIMFDDRAHRVLPMALGNLVNGKWKVAGVYNPAMKKFTERSEIIQWPKTNKSAPRSWLSCNPGEQLTSRARGLQQCEPCEEGTYSVGGQSTICEECAPGEMTVAAATAMMMLPNCLRRLLPTRTRAVRLHQLR
jgi:hypothetical protein